MWCCSSPDCQSRTAASATSDGGAKNSRLVRTVRARISHAAKITTRVVSGRRMAVTRSRASQGVRAEPEREDAATVMDGGFLNGSSEPNNLAAGGQGLVVARIERSEMRVVRDARAGP